MKIKHFVVWSEKNPDSTRNVCNGKMTGAWTTDKKKVTCLGCHRASRKTKGKS